MPPTVGENLQLNKKPTAHHELLNSLAVGLGPLPTEEAQLKYLNFYGNLLKKVDGQLGELMAVLAPAKKTRRGPPCSITP